MAIGVQPDHRERREPGQLLARGDAVGAHRPGQLLPQLGILEADRERLAHPQVVGHQHIALEVIDAVQAIDRGGCGVEGATDDLLEPRSGQLVVDGHVVLPAGREPHEHQLAPLLDRGEPVGAVHHVLGRLQLAALAGVGVDLQQVRDGPGARPDPPVDDPEPEDVVGVGGLGAVVLDVPGGRVVGHHLRIGVGAEVEAAVLADRAVVEHALPVDVLGQQRDLEGVRVQGEQAAVHGGAAGEVDRAIRRGGDEPADLGALDLGAEDPLAHERIDHRERRRDR